jgi:hypothetical protein
MSFGRVNPGGWAPNAKLTSTQQNQLDYDHSLAVDKTGDSLLGNLTLNGAGSNSGSAGSIISTSPATMSGLVSLNTNMVGELVTITGAANSGNNGTFPIASVSELAGSITYNNFSAVAPDTNNGTITWTINTPAAQILLPNAGARIETFVPLGFFVNANGGLVSFAGNGGIALCGGSNDYPTYSTISGGAVVSSPRSFTRAYPLVLSMFVSGSFTLGSSGINALYGQASTVSQQLLLPNLWNGATITSVSVTMTVAGAHTALPAVYPSLTVLRNPIGAGSNFGFQQLSSSFPQSFPTPANVTAYKDGGLTQLLTFTCNQNNVVDSTQYVYVINLTDESGTNSVVNNFYSGILVNYTVPTMAPQ